MPEGYTFEEFRKCATDAKKLVAIFTSETAATLPLQYRAAVSADLSGAGVTLIVFHTERACTLLKATVLYTEASSADGGINISVGKEGSDAYYVAAEASEKSKAQWYSKDLTLAATDIAAGDTVTFTSAGGKVGTGEIMLVIECRIND